MAAPKCVHALMIALLLNWRVCFANRAISDKNQEVAKKPEALNGAAGATWSWGSNGGAGAAGIGFNIGGGSGSTPPVSGAGSGTGSGSGSGCGCGSGSTSSCSGCGSGSSGSGAGCSCPGQGGGCQGSVGIPSVVIPGFLVPIPLSGLYCTPIESCPAGNCGGIRLIFYHSQYATASTNSTTTTTTNANQETMTQSPNQHGIKSDDHDHNLTDNINAGSLPENEEKSVPDGSYRSDEAIDHHHDRNMNAFAPESI